MTDWIEVETALPKDGELVWASGFMGDDSALERWYVSAKYDAETGLFVEATDGDELYPPTHWAKLSVLSAKLH